MAELNTGDILAASLFHHASHSNVSQLIRQPLLKYGTRSMLFRSRRLADLLREFLDPVLKIARSGDRDCKTPELRSFPAGRAGPPWPTDYLSCIMQFLWYCG